MVCFLGHCEVIVLEGRQGLVTPQLVILQCSLILERTVFQKCGSATIEPIFKSFLLPPSFNWEEFVRRKKKKRKMFFIFHLLSALMCPYFVFYKPCFLFLGSFDQNLSFGSASILAFLRQSPSACPGILKLILQRGWCVVCECVSVGVTHVGPLSPHTCLQQSGSLRGAGAPPVLGRMWGHSSLGHCEVGHWKKPPFQRLFAALGREQGKRQLLCKSFVAVRKFATESSFPLTGILWSQKGNGDVSKC